MKARLAYAAVPLGAVVVGAVTFGVWPPSRHFGPPGSPQPGISRGLPAALARSTDETGILARSWSASYAEAAWCGPLSAASGSNEAKLETLVASSTRSFAATDPLGIDLEPSLGQAGAGTGPAASAQDTNDLATATAIVLPGADPSATTLRDLYCDSSAPASALAHLTSSGGTVPVSFEVAYQTTTAGVTSDWHLWWRADEVFGPCKVMVVCLTSWDKGPVSYWASPTVSVSPQWVGRHVGAPYLGPPPSAVRAAEARAGEAHHAKIAPAEIAKLPAWERKILAHAPGRHP